LPSPSLWRQQSAVHGHQCPHQGQSDAEPALRAIQGSRRLHEQIEDALEQIGTNAGAVVPDPHHGVPVLQRGLDADVTARVRVLRGVVQEVRLDLLESSGVARRRPGRRGRALPVSRIPACLHRAAQRIARVLDDGSKVDRLALELDLVLRDPAHVEQSRRAGATSACDCRSMI